MVPNDSKLNAILENAVNEWVKNDPKSRQEHQLTNELLSKKIKEEFTGINGSVHVAAEKQVNIGARHGRFDILLYSGSDVCSEKLLALIEIGHKN